jgi:hypothetical protein
VQYDAWIWGGVGVMILSAVVLNACVIFALTCLKGVCTSNLLAHRS